MGINRKSFNFLGAEESEAYLQFLKDHFFEVVKPKYYCVSYSKKLKSEYFLVTLTSELYDPSLEPIAECWINGHFLYFWRDECWTIAVNNKGIDIYRLTNNKQKQLVIHRV